MPTQEKISTEWDNDRKLFMAILAGTGLFLIVQTIVERDFVLAGWPNVRLIAAIILFAIVGGLFYRHEWSRWALVVLIACGVIATVRNAFVEGPTMLRLFYLFFGPYGLWIAYKMPITGAQAVMAVVRGDVDGFNRRVEKRVEELESRNNWHIELTFAKPLQMTIHDVATTIARLSKLKFTVLDCEIDPIDASFLPEEHPEPTVAGQSPIFVCSVPPDLFGIYLLNRDADDESDGPSKKPQSWLKIELLPQISRREPVENGYQRTGRIASVFLSEDCLQVELPEISLCVANKDGLRTALLSEDPHSELLRLMD